MRLMAAHDAARARALVLRAARCAVVTRTVDPRAQRKQHTTRIGQAAAPMYHLHRAAHVVPAARRGARAIAHAQRATVRLASKSSRRPSKALTRSSFQRPLPLRDARDHAREGDHAALHTPGFTP